MTRSMDVIERHPDLAELRARYEAAGQSVPAQIADGLVFLAGLYLAISAWVVGFTGVHPLMVNDLITGIALAVLGGGLASAFGRTHGLAWVAPIVGVWTIIAPWVIRGSVATTSTIASNAAAGGTAVVFGLVAASLGALSRR